MKHSLLVHIETADRDGGEDIPECPDGGQGLCADETKGSRQNRKKCVKFFRPFYGGSKKSVKNYTLFFFLF